MAETDIRITKSDVAWSYIAQFLQVAAGIIVLPFILNKLPAEEIGLNYLMLTISALVGLLDFGFSPQFGRNISYIIGGAQSLQKDGIENGSASDTINFRLLATMIKVARKVYRILSLIVLALMLTGGTVYIWYATDGFKSVQNTLVIWVVFSISTFFNVYFTYYNSLLTGSGKIKESKYAVIASKLCYILLCIVFVYSGLSLLGLCLANLISPFVSRFISYRYFFTPEMRQELARHDISREEQSGLFSTIWYNAKKLGINFVGAYAINRMGMFIAGLFLSLEEVSSYGLMIQLVTLVGTVSLMLFNTLQPKFAVYKIQNDNDSLMKEFSSSMAVFYLLYILGCAALLLLGQPALDLINSKTSLPSTAIVLLYCIVVLLEQNHSAFASIIVAGNSVPFVKAGLISGGFIILTSFISLKWLGLGILGLVLSQGLCQLAYNNWRWPEYVLREQGTGFLRFLRMGASGMCGYVKSQLKKDAR